LLIRGYQQTVGATKRFRVEQLNKRCRKNLLFVGVSQEVGVKTRSRGWPVNGRSGPKTTWPKTLPLRDDATFIRNDIVIDENLRL